MNVTTPLQWTDVRDLAQDVTGIPSVMIDLYYNREEIPEYEVNAPISDRDILILNGIEFKSIHFIL